MAVRHDNLDDLIRKACATFRQDDFTLGSVKNDTPVGCSKRLFPSTWSAKSGIQLVTPKQSDTSDRSLFDRARLAAFDRDGYKHDKALRRPLYYKSGYITCIKCNGLTFIDASALRSTLELKHHHRESLPSCVGCGETSGLRVGAHDFLSLIEGGKEALTARRRAERNGAIALQRAFRRYLNIQWSQAETTRQRTIFLLRYRSAQVMQSMLRGRLGRRVFETEMHLLVIKKANRLLMQHALKRYPDRIRVFWYNNSAEEEQLYSDYRILVQRSGFHPPRMVVENNIREIAQRILERKTELASQIQARWRGISVRRYIVVFRREIRRQRQVRVGMALRIQRATRGWYHQRLARRWRSQRAAHEAMEQYRCESKAKADEDAQRCGSRNLFREYVRERQEELTARLMGHTDPKMAGGFKMKAFYESPYGKDTLASMMNSEIREALQRKNAAREKDIAGKQRAEKVRLKIVEDPLMVTYFREEMIARNVYVINKLRSNSYRAPKVSEILRHHSQTGGQKYNFPRDINDDPMAVLHRKNAKGPSPVIGGKILSQPEGNQHY